MDAPIDDDIVGRWTEFFMDREFPKDQPGSTYYDEILTVVDTDTSPLYVNYWDVHKFDEEFAEKLLKQPERWIANAEKAIIDLCPPDEEETIHFRVINLPETSHIKLKDIEPEMSTTMKAFEVSIRGVKQARPKIVNATFRCEKCGFQMRVKWGYLKEPEPYKCLNENCERGETKTKFTLLEDLSDKITEEVITVEDLRDYKSVEPYKLRVRLLHDLAKQIVGGQHIVINGIIKVTKFKNVWDYYIEANSIEKLDMGYDDVPITKEDKKAILELGESPAVFKRFAQSIAPGIYGLDDVKQACVLQLFGGIEKNLDNTERTRGDIHMLLLGEPGLGKSQILYFISKVAPRGILASGKTVSAAGLTAAAIKDELEGGFTVEGGVLVRADRGTACIDELDKMSKDEAGAMHQGLEQQQIDFSKGGISTTLMCRCSVLAAANPKEGRFTGDNVLSQVNLTSTLINRFDLIFTVRDELDREHDKKLSAVLLGKHYYMTTKQYYPEENIDDIEEYRHLMPSVDEDMMRKYIAYARRNYFPRLSEEARNAIQIKYVEIRDECKSENEKYGVKRIPITPRQLEALQRMTEAAARARLSNTATSSDAELALRVFKASMEDVALDAEGKIDIDIICTGIASKQRTVIQQVVSIFAETQRKYPGGIPMEKLLEYGKSMGMEEKEITNALAMLEEKDEIYLPRLDHYMMAGLL